MSLKVLAIGLFFGFIISQIISQARHKRRVRASRKKEAVNIKIISNGIKYLGRKNLDRSSTDELKVLIKVIQEKIDSRT